MSKAVCGVRKKTLPTCTGQSSHIIPIAHQPTVSAARAAVARSTPTRRSHLLCACGSGRRRSAAAGGGRARGGSVCVFVGGIGEEEVVSRVWGSYYILYSMYYIIFILYISLHHKPIQQYTHPSTPPPPHT